MNLLKSTCVAMAASSVSAWFSELTDQTLPSVAKTASEEEIHSGSWSDYLTLQGGSIATTLLAIPLFRKLNQQGRVALVTLGACLIASQLLPDSYMSHIRYVQVAQIANPYSLDNFNFPKVTYQNFEDLYKDPVSTYFNLSKENVNKLPNHLAIGFINGVWNQFNHAQESAVYLSKLAGGYNIHGIYNPTHGMHADVQEYVMNLNYVATEPVRKLHELWNHFFQNSPSNSTFLTICHSQGAVQVRNALLDYSSLLRKRIFVIAVAPGGYIYHETCGQVVHYRANPWRDFIPQIDWQGAMRETHFTVELDSNEKAGLFDHTFVSPTYEKSLREGIATYIETQGGSIT